MGDYCIKDGYEHGTANLTYEENPGDYWDQSRMLLSRNAQYAVYDEAAKLMRAKGLNTALDVGCGLGHKMVEALAPIAQKLVGVDQATAVQVAAQIHPEAVKKGVQFVTDDLEKPTGSVPDKFDLIICADVIEHMLDPNVLLDYILAHCHEQTYVFISTPERDVRRGKDCMRSPRKEHVREWNQQELGNYLRSRGFNVIRHENIPGFRIAGSLFLMKERFRLFRKRISYRYCQMAVCQPA